MTLAPLVVVTGASSGIGAATAGRYVKAGYRVAALARRFDRLEQLRDDLGENWIIPIQLDVRVLQDVERVILQIENEIGPIEILVNNAGGAFGLDLAQEAKLEDWEQCIDVNINGLVYCTRFVLPFMVKRNRGHVINVGSVAATYPYPGGNVYGGAKAFVRQFSLNLRSDLFGTQVRVSCIEPGLTGGTEFSLVRFHGDAEQAAAVYANTEPLIAEDVADTIFYCSSAPAHVNINTIELMPTCQAFNRLAVNRSVAS